MSLHQAQYRHSQHHNPNHHHLETIGVIADLLYQGKPIESPEIRLALHHLCIEADVFRLSYGNNANKLRNTIR